VLWRPLWFPHKNDVRFVFTPLDCSRDHGLFVFVAHSVVQHVLTIWVTWRVSYMKQELLTLREHLSCFGGVRIAHLFRFFALLYVSWCSEFRVVMSVIISTYKRCSVRFYFQLFVRGPMSYLRYLCLCAYSGAQHILCCVFGLFFSGLSRFDCPCGILDRLPVCKTVNKCSIMTKYNQDPRNK
jgi:hypothetical protein